MTTKKAIDQLAIMLVQDAMMHKICCDAGWPDGLQKKYREFGLKTKEFSEKHLHKLVKNVTISGFHNGDVSHYDIDEDLKDKFGEAVQCDSESGNFFAYCNKKDEKKVLEYLNKKYDKSVFDPKPYESDAKYFANWYHAEKHVKDNNLTVPPIPIDAGKLKRLESIQQEIDKKNREVQELQASLSCVF